MVADVDELQRRHTKGHGEAILTIQDIHAATFTAENRAKVDESALRSTDKLLLGLINATGRHKELRDAMEEVHGNRLFDVTDLSSARLFNKLALGPGEAADFFAPGDYPGWPIRTPPTWFKPFLRVGARVYCFYPYFTDSFYRAVSRVVRQLDRTYEVRWNELQQAASEAASLALLTQLLPGADVHCNVYYRAPRVDGEGTDWCECDAVITLDGLMLVVEVKGGALAYTPPATDLPAYLRSIESLLVAPATQAERLVTALRTTGSLDLCDAQHVVQHTVRRSDYTTVLPVAVTIDQLTQISGVLYQHYLQEVGKSLEPTWCVSLDDLMACRDVFTSPIRFVHYLQNRMQAFTSTKLHGLDELDHIGCYLKENTYVQAFEELPAGTVSVTGYRDILDQYFQAWWESGIRPSPPTQPLNEVLTDIIAQLERDRPPGYLRCGAALLDLDGNTRDALAEMITSARLAAAGNGRSNTVDLGGPGCSLFVHVLPEPRSAAEEIAKCRDHALALLTIGPHQQGTSIELMLSPSGRLIRADCGVLTTSGLDPERLADLTRRADRVVAARFARAAREGVKIGRNDTCPCGSGKKYKKCHMLRREQP